MKEFASIVLLGGMLALGGASAVSAQQVVEHSGRVFHIKACPANQGPGMARCFAHIVTDSRGNVIANITPSGLNPTQLRAAYSISPATGSLGSGATVAIVDAYGYPSAAADLVKYRTLFGLGTCSTGTATGCFLTIVNQNGGTSLPQTNTGWDQEQALDLDMVSSMCPSCQILLVQASSATFANLAAAVSYAAAHAHVVSNSYGGGETGSSPYESAYNHSTVAITASTGDSGYGAQFPATSPHVIAVGGTSLHMSGNTRLSETVWSGGGSGCSALYSPYSWQQPSNSNMANNTLCTNRMEADVSADADPNTGVAVYGPVNRRSSGWLVFGGTSVAAPLIGGIFGEKNDAVNYAGNIYSRNKSNPSDLYDITSGNNGNCGLGYYCNAEVGYDGPTGLGTPNGDSAF
jgi:subtilase family serine protease